MKTFFSEYHYSKTVRESLKSFPRKERDLGMQGVLHLTSLPPEESTDTFAHIWDAQEMMLSGFGIDYFITTAFLADKLLTYIKGDYSATLLDIFAEHRWSTFVIHPPSPRPAVLVSIRTINGATSVVFQEKGSVSNIKCNGSGIRPAAFIGGKHVKPMGYADRLAAGLAVYIRLNADAVREGLPEIALHPNHFKGKRCAGIIIPERLIDRSGPIPHPRIGHPRFLQSDKFTHKKGTVVQVKSTYVKGKCKIVVEVEE